VKKTSTRYAATKVPAVTPYFWASKILLTATGEAISDAMNQQFGPGIAFPIMLILLILALRWQLRQDRYRAWPYWSVVAAVAIIGTSCADGFHVGLGIPYSITTAGFAIVLAIVFTAWYRSEGSLDIHTITNQRRERFYWLTVLASFTLGTAAGDFTATSLHLDYLPSVLLFGAIILIPWFLYKRIGVNEVFCFWFAYTVTRPFGASWADYSDMPIHQAGLNLGQIPTAIYLGLISLGLVTYMAYRRVGVVEAAPGAAGGPPAERPTAVPHPHPHGHPQPAESPSRLGLEAD
jgi:uncharacterized membrane-anchored protein